MRGNSQDRNINVHYIESLFRKVKNIKVLNITGGEPSLAIRELDTLIDLIDHYKVKIDSFYIATNASLYDPEFAKLCAELGVFCITNKNSEIAISNDKYHKLNKDQVKLLSQLKYTKMRYNDNEKSYSIENKGYLIKQGRQKTGRKLIEYPFKIKNKTITENEIYLNCNGNIINGSDWAYDNQERYKICHVSKMSLDKFKEYIKKRSW